MNFSLRDSSVLYLVPPTSSTNAVTARDVSFDPAPSDFASTNVQDVVDELASRPMEIDRLGLVFGRQDIPNNSDGYGHLCNPGPASLTIYSPNGPNQPQLMNMTNSIVVVNNVSDDATCNVDEATLVVNSAIVQGVDLRRSVMLATKIQNMGPEFPGSLLVGSFVDANLIRAPGSLIFFADSQSGNLVDIDGEYCGYIGNGKVAVTVNDEQFYISEFKEWFLQTLPPGQSTYCVHYDPSDGRLSYDIFPPASVQDKQSLAPGSQYGFTQHSTNAIENVGYRNAPNYQVTSAAIINNATLLGQDIFQNASGGTIQSSIVLGMKLTMAPNAEIRNSLIAANSFSNTSALGIINCIVMAPKLDGLVTAGVPSVPLQDSVVISPGTMTFSSNSPAAPSVSNTLSICTNNTVMGAKNLILCRSTSLTQVHQNNIDGGHIIIANLERPYTIGSANAFRRNIILLTDSATLPEPTIDNAFVSNAIHFLHPALTAQTFVSPSTSEANRIRNVLFNTGTGQMAPVQRTAGGFGLGPTQWNFKATATLVGVTRRASISIPTELRDPGILPFITVTCTAENPTGNQNTLYTAGYLGVISGTNMVFFAYEQPVGGALNHAQTNVTINILLSY